MTRGILGNYPTSVNLAFELLVEEDGERQQQRLQRVTSGFKSSGPQVSMSQRASLVPDLETLSMSAAEVLQELLGRLYIDHQRLTYLEVIGEGGFASVHKCQLHVVLNFHTDVAVKKLKPEVFQGVGELKEFLLEANILRKMHHPHIVELLGVGAADLTDLNTARASMFLVQEYMGGGDLKALLVKHMAQPFEPLFTRQDALRWGIHIAEAMHYLHAVCRPMVIHRDLKLENVLLTEGPLFEAQAKLADFGLHKRAQNAHKVSLSSQLPPAYSGDPERSYYGGASYYSAVLEHDKSLICTSPTGLPPSMGVQQAPGTPLPSMSDTSARLLELILKDSVDPMDDMSVHRKRRALQVLEQIDGSEEISLSGHSPEPSQHLSHAFSAPLTLSGVSATSDLSVPRLPRPNSHGNLVSSVVSSTSDMTSPRLPRPASYGNLAQKRVTFMDVIPERRNSDSSMPRLSLDSGTIVAEGGGAADGGSATPKHSPSGAKRQEVALMGEDFKPQLLATLQGYPSIAEDGEGSFSNGGTTIYKDAGESAGSWAQVMTGVAAGGAKHQTGVELTPGGNGPASDTQALGVALLQSSGSLVASGAGFDDVANKGSRSGNVGNSRGSWKGSSMGLGMDASQKVGSLLYMAPEMTLAQSYNEKVDVFAFGVLLYELFMGQSLLVRLAVRSECELENSEAFMMTYAQSVAEGFREDIPDWWPTGLQRLVSDCWHQEPTKRPSFALILQRLHGLHADGSVADMDARRKKGYNPAKDCGCSIMPLTDLTDGAFGMMDLTREHGSSRRACGMGGW